MERKIFTWPVFKVNVLPGLLGSGVYGGGFFKDYLKLFFEVIGMLDSPKSLGEWNDRDAKRFGSS